MIRTVCCWRLWLTGEQMWSNIYSLFRIVHLRCKCLLTKELRFLSLLVSPLVCLRQKSKWRKEDQKGTQEKRGPRKKLFRLEVYPTRGANSSTCVHVKSRPKKWLMLGFPNNVLLKTLQGELYMLQIFVKYYLRVVLTFPHSGGSSSGARWWLIDYLLLLIISLSAPQLKKIICSSLLSHYLLLSWKRLSAPQLKKKIILRFSAEKLSKKNPARDVLCWLLLQGLPTGDSSPLGLR